MKPYGHKSMIHLPASMVVVYQNTVSNVIPERNAIRVVERLRDSLRNLVFFTQLIEGDVWE